MEIFILRDGQQTGPYSEDDTQQLLKQGVVLINDLAWQHGMTEWIPLHSVLYPGPAAQPVSAPEPPAPAQSAEPATAKQRAFLTYLGLNVAATASKEDAALIVNDAMEDPKNAAKVAKWNLERLTLHPDLFAEEVQARKEQRIQRYFEICQTDGEEVLEGVTKAHCQVLVGYLDVKFPNWDANPAEAPHTYFFPAIAEKFPQLVRPEWKGKLRAPQGPKVAPEIKRKAAVKPIATTTRKKSSPIASLVKGFVLGLLLVGLVGGGLFLYSNPAAREELLAKVKPQAAPAGKPVASEKTEEAPSADSAPANPPAPEPEPAKAAPMLAETAAPAPAPAPAPVPVPAAEPAPMAQPAAPAMAAPAAEMPMTPAPAAAAEPAPAAPATGGMALFDPTGGAPAKPASPDGAMAGESTLPAPKAVATLTQLVEVQSPYGVLKIPAGTKLPIVEQDGLSLKVRFQNQVIAVPVSSTDLAAESLF